MCGNEKPRLDGKRIFFAKRGMLPNRRGRPFLFCSLSERRALWIIHYKVCQRELSRRSCGFHSFSCIFLRSCSGGRCSLLDRRKKWSEICSSGRGISCGCSRKHSRAISIFRRRSGFPNGKYPLRKLRCHASHWYVETFFESLRKRSLKALFFGNKKPPGRDGFLLWET